MKLFYKEKEDSRRIIHILGLRILDIYSLENYVFKMQKAGFVIKDIKQNEDIIELFML